MYCLIEITSWRPMRTPIADWKPHWGSSLSKLFWTSTRWKIWRWGGPVCHYLSLTHLWQSRLSENMSNFRAIDSLLQEAFTGLQVYCSQFFVSHWFSSFVQQRNSKRADRALQTQVPHINAELEESMESLTQLSQTLPKIQSQVVDIRLVHDSGREKVCLSWRRDVFVLKR